MADNLSLQFESVLAGGEPTWTNASGSGHQFPNSGKVVVYVENQRDTTVNIVFQSRRSCEFGTHSNKTYTVPANKLWKSPQLDPRRFTGIDGLAIFTLSQTSQVRVAAVVLSTAYQN